MEADYDCADEDLKVSESSEVVDLPQEWPWSGEAVAWLQHHKFGPSLEWHGTVGTPSGNLTTIAAIYRFAAGGVVAKN